MPHQVVWTYKIPAHIFYEVYVDTEEEAEEALQDAITKSFEHNPTEGRTKYGTVRVYVHQDEHEEIIPDGMFTILYPRTEEEIANLTPEEEAKRQALKALGYEVD